MRDVKFRVYDEGRMKYPEEYKEIRYIKRKDKNND